MAVFRFDKVIGALRLPNYGIYVAGNTVTLIGTWMQRIASGWLVWELTGSATWLGAVAFADLFPAVLIAPLAGVSADRWDRMRIMRITQALGALIACLFAVTYFAGAMTVGIVLGLTLMLGIVDAFAQPYRLAIVSALVPRSELTTAVAINSVTFNLARFIGPAIAGVVIATGGVGWAFALNAATFLVHMLALLYVRPVQNVRRVRSAGSSLLREALDGARYAIVTPGIGVVLLLFGTICVTARPVVELLPGWVGDIFGGNPTDLAALTSAIGVGAVAGGLWLAGRPSVVGLVRILLLGAFGLAASLLAFSATPNILVALPVIAVGGFFLVTTAICAQTLVQLNVADDVRGRVLSFYGFVLKGGPAIGALITGYAADSVGLRLPLVVAMGFLLLVTFLVLMRHDRIRALLESPD